MIERARSSDSDNLIVATETGVIHKMKKVAPEKNFIPISSSATCKYMKMISADKVLRALEEEVLEVKVSSNIASKAKLAIDRMISIV